MTIHRQNLFALGAVLLWAGAFVMVRYLTEFFSPSAISSLRLAVASLTALLLLVRFRLQKLHLRDVPLLFVSSLCAYSLYSYLTATGAQTVTASVTSFLSALVPVLVPFAAAIVLGERITRIQKISMCLSGFGVLLILFLDDTLAIEPGLIFVLFATLLSVVNLVVQRLLLRRYDNFTVTVYAIFLGTLTMSYELPASVLELRAAPLWAVLLLLLLGVNTIVAFLFWTKALELTDSSSKVASFTLLIPLLSTLLAFLTIGELPPVSTYIGGAFMLAGLILVNRPAKTEFETISAPSADAETLECARDEDEEVGNECDS